MNNQSTNELRLTVGELKEHLSIHDDHEEIIFQGGMTFYRLKTRGVNLVQMEFNETVVVHKD